MDHPAQPPPVRIRPSLRDAVLCGARYFGLSLADFTGSRRYASISRARMATMAVVRELTGASYPEIGLHFGGKDHSTVINACQRAKVDPKLAELVKEFRPVLQEYLRHRGREVLS